MNRSAYQATPKGNRLHLGIFGRRNVGKSSLLNAMTRQNSSIVSATPGTTTDPVEKPMEFLPLGPVLFLDTAGVDDTGTLGALRVAKTQSVLDRTDLAILVLDPTLADGGWSEFESQLVEQFAERKIPIVAVLGKADLSPDTRFVESMLTERNILFVRMTNGSNSSNGLNLSRHTSDEEAARRVGVTALRDLLVSLVPDNFLTPPPIVADLIPPGELAILVTPIDKEAPKGRLILPEVQTLRDILDHGQLAMVVQTAQLAEAIRRGSPKLVVTDSQAFAEVNRIVPPEIPLTSFSILFARQKGDFAVMRRGAKTIEQLGPDARILIAEACTHHPIAEDIGTEKIPHLLRARLGNDIIIGHVQGHDFPPDEALSSWDLVIHCGGCIWNRREMLRRIARCDAAGVPITNYGLALAQLHGILDRATEMF